MSLVAWLHLRVSGQLRAAGARRRPLTREDPRIQVPVGPGDGSHNRERPSKIIHNLGKL